MSCCRRVLLLLIAVCLLTSPSLAQSPKRPNQQTVAAAEALFVDALELMQQDKFEPAAEKLERSANLDPQPGTLLNLATCYEELERTASAWRTYRRAATVATRHGDPREQKARDAAERLEPRLTRLGVRVAEGNRVPGLTVRRDGEEIDAELFGEPFPVDPGETKIVASAPDHIEWIRQVDVTASLEPIWVDIPKLRPEPRTTTPGPTEPQASEPLPPPEPTPPAAPPPNDVPVDQPRQRGLPVAAKVAGVVALVEFAGAAGLAAAAVATDRTGEDYCTKVACEPRGVTLKERAVRLGSAAAWVAAAGGITLGFAVGVTLESRRKGRGPGVALRIAPGPRGGVGEQWR